MTFKQTILKAVYPFLMRLTRVNATILENKNLKRPPVSFYNLQALLANHTAFNFANAKGKKLLLVNTASNCGYTAQYQELQQLYNQYQDKLVMIGFPSNDFKEQEKLSDEEIASFCQVNYGVTFPIAKKSVVVKGPNQNEVFKWLSQQHFNGWNNQPPSWNFSKYLINEEGVLTHYFGPSVSPLSKTIVEAL